MPQRSEEEKFTDLGLGLGCATAHGYTAQTMRVIKSGRSRSTPRMRAALEYLDEFERALMVPRDLPEAAGERRDELIRALGDVKHLYRTIVRANRGALKGQAVDRAGKRYNRGAEKVKRFAQAYPFSGRLF